MSGDYELRLLLAGHEMGSQPLRDLPLVVGSAPGSGLQVLAPGVAPQHLRIFARAAQLWVEPVAPGLAARLNGTDVFLAELHPGDQLELGPYTLELQRLEPPGAEVGTPQQAAAGLPAHPESDLQLPPAPVDDLPTPRTLSPVSVEWADGTLGTPDDDQPTPQLLSPVLPGTGVSSQSPTPEVSPASHGDDDDDDDDEVVTRTGIDLTQQQRAVLEQLATPSAVETTRAASPGAVTSPSVVLGPGLLDPTVTRESPYPGAWARWQLWGTMGLSAVLHIGLLLTTMALSGDGGAERLRGFNAASANRFVRVIIEKPRSQAPTSGGEEGESDGRRDRRRRGRSRGKSDGRVERDEGRAGGRAWLRSETDGARGGGGRALRQLFSGARTGSGPAIDLGGRGRDGGAGSSTGTFDPLAVGLPGGGGQGGGVGSGDGRKELEALLGGKGKRGRRGRQRVGRALLKADRGSVRGGLDPDKVRRVIRAKHASLRRCYINRLQTRPGLQGRITVHFVIGSAGRVTRVSSFDTIGDAALKRCIENRFKALRFPRPRGADVTVNYPLTFRLPD